MNAFNDYFLDTIKNRYADFDGRARRSEYWYFILFYFLMAFAISILSGLLGLISESLAVAAPALLVILVLAMFIPNLALAVRRLHDTDKSGWLLLIGIIPLVGSIILLVFYCTEGTRGQNQYGPDPKSKSDNLGGNLGSDILA